MKVYRTLLPDQFIDVEAESEDAAKDAAVEILKREIRPEQIICWEDETAKPSLMVGESQ